MIARVHLADAGRAAAARAGPLLVGVAIIAAILFSRNGMTARDALGAMDAVPLLRGGLFVAWILASAPAARPLFGTPSTLYLRSLAPPARFLAPITFGLALLETPWVLLHARGAGVLGGVAALLSAAAAHALLAAGRLGLVAAAGIAVAVTLSPALPLALAGALGCVAGLPAAFHAAAVAPVHGRPAVAGPPAVALALAGLVSSWRGAHAAWTRALIVVGAGGAASALLSRNHELEGWPRVRLALGVGGPVLVLALGGIVQALLAAEVAAVWLLDATGVPAHTRAAARALALAAVGALAGLGHGLLSAGFPGGAAGLVWGAAVALVLGPAVKRGRGRDDVTFFLAVAVAAAFAVLAGTLP